jgi:phosphatidylinositol glycan class V
MSTSTSSSSSTVVHVAIVSRIFVWTLAFLSNTILPCYDKSSTTIWPSLRYGESSSVSVSWLDTLIVRLFSFFGHWDGMHMLRIAEFGYEVEKEHAFFPALPFTMRYVAHALHILIPIQISFRTLLLLSGVIITNVSFIVAAVALHKYVSLASLCFLNLFDISVHYVVIDSLD